jgi:hypothetical protein
MICDDKARFPNKPQALLAASRYIRPTRRHETPYKLRAYLCPDCGHWHLTKRSRSTA